MGAVARQPLDFVLIAVVGVANAIIDVPLFTLPVRLVSDAVLARAFGVFESLITLGVGLGSVASPILIAVLGLAAGDGRHRRPPPRPGRVALATPARARRTAGRPRRRDRRLRRTSMLQLLPVPSIEHLASRVGHHPVPAGTDRACRASPGTASS